jgi:hypothetical protein
VVAGCLAFALVVGALFAADGRRLGVGLAGAVVALFVTGAHYLAPHTPVRGGVFWHGSFMLSLCVAERVYYNSHLGIILFSAGMVWLLALGAVMHRPVGPGGVIR